MVSIKLLPVATMAILFSFAAARNCKAGTRYCGSTLLRIGKYQEQVDAALEKAYHEHNGREEQDTLFSCDGGPNGEISVDMFCDNGCIDGGKNKNDFCA